MRKDLTYSSISTWLKKLKRHKDLFMAAKPTRWHPELTWVRAPGKITFGIKLLCSRKYSLFEVKQCLHLNVRRMLFPGGLPPSYVFVATLKYKGSVVMEEWDLWRIQTKDEKPQMAVSLNGLDRTVMFTTTTSSTPSGTQTVVFTKLPAKVNTQLDRRTLKQFMNS